MNMAEYTSSWQSVCLCSCVSKAQINNLDLIGDKMEGNYVKL